jgi:hypothetical protein
MNGFANIVLLMLFVSGMAAGSGQPQVSSARGAHCDWRSAAAISLVSIRTKYG